MRRWDFSMVIALAMYGFRIGGTVINISGKEVQDIFEKKEQTGQNKVARGVEKRS